MKNKKNILGFIFGSMSGITWAIDTIIVGVVLMSCGNMFNYKELIVLPFIIAFLKDLFSCILLNIEMVRSKKFNYILKSILSGKVKILILGSILGGPIGMTLYIVSIKFISPEGAANISAIYPIVTAILSSIIIKEKLNFKSKLGVIFSFIGVFIVGYSKTQCNFNFMVGIGMSLVIITILCWALESILYSFQVSKVLELSSMEALAIREIVAMIVHVVIIGFICFKDINIIKIVSNIYPLILFTSCISLTSYLLWYKSIDLIGPAKATTLNVTYVLWVVVFQIVLFNENIKFNFILGSIMILIGSIFMINSKSQ
ncbi:DMT family transporter [Clostridium botulinum]|uniref:LicB protein n=1 Tax=Clostridium botulinum TaxID=1491 RepID=A0A9Q1V1A5_CLOBO|nr:DMT family transporter [Clostridium botulinum]AEB75803.1 licB protein, putative [Clostridium botulinum BKT015925]KEH98593.1 licB protein [Clostridium botulinum D str. 16868]KEI05743.1 licB protein [Clostridium botulinum C/D str. Sp77]KLU75634.1 licB protein [Clostridium botulinum V891]KOA75293.1 licB protein [Clostridium botulinum]